MSVAKCEPLPMVLSLPLLSDIFYIWNISTGSTFMASAGNGLDTCLGDPIKAAVGVGFTYDCVYGLNLLGIILYNYCYINKLNK